MSLNSTGPEGLDQFVAETDRRGGPNTPGANAYWATFSYQPSTPIDKSADPFSEPYFRRQLSLYHELSGRALDQQANEHTHFDVDAHVVAPNPYDHGTPTILATHLLRLVGAFQSGGCARNARVLDMGCGWGLSSEVAAYLGFIVTAVDINPDFVALVNRRAERLGATITAVRSAFDTFETHEKFDAILFYECLHHAVRPWTLLARMREMLAPGGCIILCGEPVNEHWWPNWGLRLDALSVYCIRKFGWFESGWSLPFIRRCLDLAGLESSVTPGADPDIGLTIIGRAQADMSIDWLARNARIEVGAIEGALILAQGTLQLFFDSLWAPGELVLVVDNHRPGPVAYQGYRDGQRVLEGVLRYGENRLTISGVTSGSRIRIASETWIPNDEIRNGDPRPIGFHVRRVGWRLDNREGEAPARAVA
jgi:2-polyprenyl-3-methyl-5-hydroxy-6-metoxy-1,4-benzoquinol methylase